MDFILRSTPTNLYVTFYDRGETTIDADGIVNVTVTKADGTVLVTDGVATHVGDPDSGEYRYDVPAQGALTALTAVWSGVFFTTYGPDPVKVTTHAEVVGGFYFTLAELRNFHSSLENTAKYPTEKLIEKRSEVEDKFEKATGRAFVRRYQRDVLSVPRTGDTSVQLTRLEPGQILSVTVDGVDVTGDLLPHLVVSLDGVLTRIDGAWWPPGVAHVVVEYEYGMETVPPSLKRAALIYARSLLIETNSNIPSRATEMLVGEDTTYRLATPGRAGYITGIPEVDEVLDSFSLNTGGVVAL